MENETFKFEGTIVLNANYDENIDKIIDFMEIKNDISCLVDIDDSIIFNSQYIFPSIFDELKELIKTVGGGIIDYEYHDTECDDWGETNQCKLEITT